MKSHLISDISTLGNWAESLCGKVLTEQSLVRMRSAKKCKRCKKLLKKEWYVEG